MQTADWEKPDTPRSAGASASQSFGFVSGQSRQGLAAPPLYAATVPPGRSLSECFQVAEGQLDQIQGVLSRKDTTVAVDERPQQEKDGDARAAAERPPAASSSSDSGTRTTKRRAPTNAAREGSPSRSRAELSVAVARQGELSQELVKAQGALIATQQAVSAVAGADGTIRAAGSSAGYVKHVDVLKAVKQPQSLKEKDQWERFGFQVDAYLALLDAEYPVELEKARKATSPISVSSMQEATADRGRKLFAMLLSWTQELSIAVKIARGIRENNGFEFWRLLHREFNPENHSKSLMWRRSLLSPKFPAKEGDFSSAMQEWEADLHKSSQNTAQRKPLATRIREP